MRAIIMASINSIKTWPEKTIFLRGGLGLKFSDLRLALGMALKFYTSVANGSKLKVRKFYGLVSTFGKVTGETLVGGLSCPPS